jgi:hypothetical protein
MSQAIYAQNQEPAEGGIASRRARTDVRQQQRPAKAVWAGRILSGIAVLFLAFDAALKLSMQPLAVEGTTQLGYPEGVIFAIGMIQIVCLMVYLVPRTSVLGAILWTGYLGGAIATHVRVGNPLLTHTLFPIYVAALLWGGLWLRDRRVRALLSPPAAD